MYWGTEEDKTDEPYAPELERIAELPSEKSTPPQWPTKRRTYGILISLYERCFPRLSSNEKSKRVQSGRLVGQDTEAPNAARQSLCELQPYR